MKWNPLEWIIDRAVWEAKGSIKDSSQLSSMDDGAGGRGGSKRREEYEADFTFHCLGNP